MGRLCLARKIVIMFSLKAVTTGEKKRFNDTGRRRGRKIDCKLTICDSSLLFIKRHWSRRLIFSVISIHWARECVAEMFCNQISLLFVVNVHCKLSLRTRFFIFLARHWLRYSSSNERVRERAQKVTRSEWRQGGELVQLLQLVTYFESELCGIRIAYSTLSVLHEVISQHELEIPFSSTCFRLKKAK